MVTKGRCVLMVPPWAFFVAVLLLLPALPWRTLALCPPPCACSESHREVDCSWRGLRLLPSGLQHNVHALNLSHNRLTDLDRVLSPFSHLRSLDVSHNRLSRLPAELPRSLWELWASGNRLRLLHKNDTAYHWNLRLLDLSANKLERVVFINNTLPALRTLDLSRNRFWTVPTNIPRHVETVDLSHNTLVQVLPGSLDQLGRLQRLYLHANRFSAVSEGTLERLAALRLITLGDNPWACDEQRNISYLLSWLRRTHASVLGCPCHTWHTCGETHLATTRGWHYASYTPAPHTPGMDADGSPPHADNDLGRRRHRNRYPAPPMRAVTAGYWPESALLDMHRPRETLGSTADYQSRWPPGGFLVTSPPSGLSTPDEAYTTQRYFTASDYDSTEAALTTSTRKTTTLRTRSVKKGNQGKVPNSGHSPEASLSSTLTAMVSLLLVFAMGL
ncbi:oligodendrocyte-myelin glycoprotein-like [Alosa sapidissima]|uniref:oligodendrocyte-myelin glycoprotein-like n=1 Tax=Alosa sapidissima TaxID=34773 RepID=UPI001C097E68|nr:oligodendrocyte-myelin glycoprotein-like [Alosa sapidissima]